MVRAPRVEVSPARVPLDAGRDAVVDVPVELVVPDAAPIDVAAELAQRCHVRRLRAQDVRPLDPAIFPREQREATASGAWRPPALLGWAPPLPRGARDSVRDHLLLLLGPSEGASCVVLSVCEGAGSAPVRGPFAGIAGSDANWTAHALCGRRLVLGLFDASGAPRALRDAGEDFVGEDAWTGRGVWLEALDAFGDGRSVLLGTYASADEDTDSTLRIWSGVEGALRELGREAMTHTMGAPIRFTITRRGEAGPAPTIVVSRSAGRSEWDDAIEDVREVFSAPRRRVLRYDPQLQRFR